MAKWLNQKVLDNGLQYIKDNCDKLVLVNAYSSADAYATVMNASNVLAEADMVSADLVLSSSGQNRVLTSAAGKSDASANNAGDAANNHFAFVDTATGDVLWVTTETSAQDIVSGNGITFPSLQVAFNQPT